MLTISPGLCHNVLRTRGPLPKGGYGMDNEWNNNEYLPPQPEHSIDPEYTPEYPDVTFFKESAVTMREENIFKGEVPTGEKPQNTQKQKEQKAKQTRMSWFRRFLGSAMRGGAALLAASTLIVNAAEGDSSAAARRIQGLVLKLRKDAIEQPSDYTPDELGGIWDSDPEAPHNYDFSNLIVVEEPTCTKPGVSCYVCRDCGVKLLQTTTKPHTPAAPVEEKRVEPDCTHDGSYEEVTYCKICGAEISRILRVLYAPGHTTGEYVVENAVEPNCTENGSEDDVFYCTVCGEEVSRTTVTIAALGHTPNEPVIENTVDPSCTEDGSEDEVVYCSVCGEEISRTTVVLEALGHTEGELVIENTVDPKCTADGSEDEVIYCSVCGEELSRTTEVIPALGHSYTLKVTDPTCTAQGYTTHTCSRCGSSYKDTYKAALGHSYTSKVTAATCTAQGYTTYTCSRCGDSYKGNTTAALGHSYTDTVTAPTCTAQGYTTHTCSRCGDSYKDSTTAALGHSYTATVTAPTCTAQGYTTHTCSRCGNNYKDTYTAALGHHFDIQTWNWSPVDDNGNYDNSGARIPVMTCSRNCGTPAFTISFVNGNTISYNINADFWSQAESEGYYALEWGDCSGGDDTFVAYIADGSEEATSRTGQIVLDFTPVSGRTYTYKICLRVASSGSSDDVCFVAPQGGGKRTYTAP